MRYTRAQILLQCRKDFENKDSFYKQEYINYRGKTSDTEEYYTEVIAEFLCDHFIEYKNGIRCITRENSYYTPGHDGEFNPASNREEEKIAMRILELKKPGSQETMLRCVLEGYTYLQIVNQRKLVVDFKKKMKEDFIYNSDEVTVKACPFVFYDSAQYKEMSQHRPFLHKLMAMLDSKPYYILKKEIYTIVEG